MTEHKCEREVFVVALFAYRLSVVCHFGGKHHLSKSISYQRYIWIGRHFIWSKLRCINKFNFWSNPAGRIELFVDKKNSIHSWNLIAIVLVRQLNSLMKFMFQMLDSEYSQLVSQLDDKWEAKKNYTYIHDVQYTRVLLKRKIRKKYIHISLHCFDYSKFSMQIGKNFDYFDLLILAIYNFFFSSHKWRFWMNV